MHGSPTIRVVRTLTHDEREENEKHYPFSEKSCETHFFYDYAEAKEFVMKHWVAGRELSARVPDCGVWEPIYMITATGEIYESAQWQNARSNAVFLGTMADDEQVRTLLRVGTMAVV
jgi:hypothetical protein